MSSIKWNGWMDRWQASQCQRNIDSGKGIIYRMSILKAVVERDAAVRECFPQDEGWFLMLHHHNEKWCAEPWPHLQSHAVCTGDALSSPQVSGAMYNYGPNQIRGREMVAASPEIQGCWDQAGCRAVNWTFWKLPARSSQRLSCLIVKDCRLLIRLRDVSCCNQWLNYLYSSVMALHTPLLSLLAFEPNNAHLVERKKNQSLCGSLKVFCSPEKTKTKIQDSQIVCEFHQMSAFFKLMFYLFMFYFY